MSDSEVEIDHLFGLSSRVKTVVGSVMFAVAASITSFIWDRGYIYIGAISFIGLFGVILVSVGMREQAEDRALEKELARIDDEWDNIVVNTRDAREKGKGVPRVLQAMGFRSIHVRRFIEEKLEAI